MHVVHTVISYSYDTVCLMVSTFNKDNVVDGQMLATC